MTLLEELGNPSSPSYSIALSVILIALLASGIALGIGRAFRNRKLENAAAEELLQSIINAALLGAIIAVTATIDSAASSVLPKYSAAELCPSTTSLALLSPSPNAFLACHLSAVQQSLFTLIESALRANFTIASISKLGLHLGVVSSQPFFGLESLSSQIASLIGNLYFLQMAISSQALFVSFILAASFAVLIPAGLLFRCFFFTRKLGGMLIALGLGLYIFFPLAYLAAPKLLDESSNDMKAGISRIDDFNRKFSAIPVADLGKENVVAEKLDDLAEKDFVGEIAILAKTLSSLAAELFTAFIILPLISIAITIVAIRELSLLLGSEISVGTFELL